MRIAVLLTIAAVLSLGVMSAHADRVLLRTDASDPYTVVKGDTLWDIAARFRKNPWKWPEVWQLNRQAIHNPHRIDPGDRIRLIGSESPQLVLERGIPTVKLSPQVKAEPMAQAEPGIPSVSYEAIAAFLDRGGVMTAEELARAPRILGSTDERVIFGTHDTVYADTGAQDVREWQIVRPGPALIDPISGEILGHQLVHIGEARTLKSGSPQLLRILHTQREVLKRDQLLPLQASEVPQFAPRALDKPIEARVAAALSGVEGAGPYTTIVLNQGWRNGLEVGHVLALYKAGRSITDPRCARAGTLAFLAGGLKAQSDCVPNDEDPSALPEQRVGLAYVYRVFDRVAYALVMNAKEPIAVGDVARPMED